MMHSMYWTRERSAKLERLYSGGLTYRQIAERMQITKNMVVGRAWRMGLPIAAKIDAMPDAIITTVTPFPDRGRCVFPHGDPGEPEYGYCCDPVARVGLPYCAAHMRIAYWVMKGESQPKKDAIR